MVASASAPRRLTAIQRRTRKTFGMRSYSVVVFGPSCPVDLFGEERPAASIVAKKKRVRKRQFDFTFFAAEPRPAGAAGVSRYPCARNQRDNLIRSVSLKQAVWAERPFSRGGLILAIDST